MSSKYIRLYYNGEVGWDASIERVTEHFKIKQDVQDWLATEEPNSRLTNAERIISAYDRKTLFRLGYLKKDEANPNELAPDETRKQDGSELRGNEPMPWPIQLHVEASQITRDILLNQSNFVQPLSAAQNFDPGSSREDGFSFTGNLDNKIWSLLSSTYKFQNFETKETIGYSDHEGVHIENQGMRSTTLKEKRNLRVWLWSKAFNELKLPDGSRKSFDKNSIMDITPFVMSASTNVVKTGGTFQLNLAPVMGDIACEIGEDGKRKAAGRWFLPDESFEVWKDDNVRNFIFKPWINEKNKNSESDIRTSDRTNGQGFQSTEFDDRVNLSDEFGAQDVLGDTVYRSMYDTDYIRTSLFFTNVIAENDIIFIGFVDDGELSEEKYHDTFFLSVDELVGQDWTMIGLVDSNSTSLSSESTDINVNITGRDCMKLLLEDGTFFFQKSYANPDQKDTAFNNKDLPKQGDDVNALNRVLSEDSVSGVNRLITSGMIETLFNQEARNVGFVMNLLVSRLANIEICPSQIFEAYGDRRSKFQVEIEEYVDENNDGDDNKEKETGFNKDFKDESH